MKCCKLVVSMHCMHTCVFLVVSLVSCSTWNVSVEVDAALRVRVVLVCEYVVSFDVSLCHAPMSSPKVAYFLQNAMTRTISYV